MQDTESLNKSSLEAIRALNSEGLKRFTHTISIIYGLSSEKEKELEATISCESNWQVSAYNKFGNSYGVAQFQPATFKENCEGTYENPFDQLSCAVQMFKRNMENRWDCWNNIFGK